MSQVAWQIPLQTNPNATAGPDLNALMRLQQASMQIKAEQQEMQSQNALKQLFSDPENVDKETGLLKPSASAKIMAENPAFGLKYNQAAAQADDARIRSLSSKSDLIAKMRETGLEMGEESVSTYDEAIKKGMTPEAAMRLGQEDYTRHLDKLKSSGFPPEYITQIPPNFDPVRIKASIIGYKNQIELDRKAEAEKRLENKPTETLQTDSGQLVQIVNGKAVPVDESALTGGRFSAPAGAPSAPTDRLALIRRLEGSGDDAVSPKGAVGRNQILPSTAKAYGFEPEKLKDPAYNDQVATAILGDLGKRYNNNLPDMLVAYNAGPKRADDWIAGGRKPADLPPETQKYLANAARYGAFGGGEEPAGGGAAPSLHKPGTAPREAEKWEVLTDPEHVDPETGKTVPAQQYRYDPVTAKATTLSGQPYTPTGASRIGASTGTTITMTPQAIETEAKRYNITGRLPPLGMGKAGDREAILNKAAELLGQRGQSPGEAIATAAGVKADTSSLANITKIADSAAAYEGTALKNMDIVRKTMPAGAGPTAIPWIDRWVESGRTEFGDEKVPPYVTSLVTVANEYAKVMSGSTGSQGSTVDSRREASELLNAGLNKGQITETLEVMKEDMENKKSSYQDKVKEIRSRISGAGEPEKPTAGSGDATHPSNMSDDELKKALGLQ